MNRLVMTRTVLALISALLLLATACSGGEGPGAAATPVRTVEVTMVDLAFQPSTIEVVDGETVRLRFTNTGDLLHDAFIGDSDAQDEHEERMAGGHGGHDGQTADAVSIQPGETAEMIHTFQTGDTVLIGCHQPGHYAAGMVVPITITTA